MSSGTIEIPLRDTDEVRKKTSGICLNELCSMQSNLFTGD